MEKDNYKDKAAYKVKNKNMIYDEKFHAQFFFRQRHFSLQILRACNLWRRLKSERIKIDICVAVIFYILYTLCIFYTRIKWFLKGSNSQSSALSWLHQDLCRWSELWPSALGQPPPKKGSEFMMLTTYGNFSCPLSCIGLHLGLSKLLLLAQDQLKPRKSFESSAHLALVF